MDRGEDFVCLESIDTSFGVSYQYRTTHVNVIIFQKLLVSPYCTLTHTHVCFLVFLHLVQTLEGLFLWKEWNLFLGGSRSVQFVIKVVEWDVRRGSKSDLLH